MKTILIHNLVMILITGVFVVIFAVIRNDVNAQNIIQENISIIPIGQLLAYEGYLGYVILRWVRSEQRGIREKITHSNVVSIVGRKFHDFASSTVDLIGITVITFGFFAVAYNPSNIDAQNTMNQSDLLFMTVLPLLSIYVAWCFRNRYVDCKLANAN